MFNVLVIRAYIALKCLYQRLSAVLRSKTAEANIPDYMIREMARCLLPYLIDFYESEEGIAAFNQWKAEQDAKKKDQSKVA